mmetsp:Transcript_33282/g.96098  ORF Transcript_33282/g.96098 Transcript_33282/m.96098 type:complete len:267 (-) Transcript_33282:246-1046(-)
MWRPSTQVTATLCELLKGALFPGELAQHLSLAEIVKDARVDLSEHDVVDTDVAPKQHKPESGHHTHFDEHSGNAIVIKVALKQRHLVVPSNGVLPHQTIHRQHRHTPIIARRRVISPLHVSPVGCRVCPVVSHGGLLHLGPLLDGLAPLEPLIRIRHLRNGRLKVPLGRTEARWVSEFAALEGLERLESDGEASGWVADGEPVVAKDGVGEGYLTRVSTTTAVEVSVRPHDALAAVELPPMTAVATHLDRRWREGHGCAHLDGLAA